MGIEAILLSQVITISGTTGQVVTRQADGTLALEDVEAPSWDDITDKPSTFPPSSHAHSGEDLTSGTIADARLSEQVAMRNASNTFSAMQVFPGTWHTVRIGQADASYSGGGTVGNQVLFHSTTYGGKTFIGYNNSGVFMCGGIAIGPTLSLTRVRVPSTAGGIFTPSIGLNNDVSGNEHGIYSNGTSVFITTNRLGQFSVGPSGTGVTDLTASGLIRSAVFTVGTLPSAAANAGKEAQVTDSSVITYRSIVAGGGANRVKVFSNGTDWLVN
jgi:hypothetical protein